MIRAVCQFSFTLQTFTILIHLTFRQAIKDMSSDAHSSRRDGGTGRSSGSTPHGSTDRPIETTQPVSTDHGHTGTPNPAPDPSQVHPTVENRSSTTDHGTTRHQSGPSGTQARAIAKVSYTTKVSESDFSKVSKAKQSEQFVLHKSVEPNKQIPNKF